MRTEMHETRARAVRQKRKAVNLFEKLKDKAQETQVESEFAGKREQISRGSCEFRKRKRREVIWKQVGLFCKSRRRGRSKGLQVRNQKVQKQAESTVCWEKRQISRGGCKFRTQKRREVVWKQVGLVCK